MHTKALFARGSGLIEVVVAAALLTVVFVGFMGVLQLSTKLASDNKAHTGATALALERMEYIRSLDYADVGVVGGSPSGILLGSEAVVLNTVAYTQETTVVYFDDGADGTGGSDTNGNTNDYKVVVVRVSWIGQNGEREVRIVSNVTPPAIEY